MLAPAAPRRAFFLRITHRLVTQAEHVWIVREVDDAESPLSPPSRCLVREGAETARRLFEYPANWSRLTDAELLKLFA
jgi:hypothetical protein